MDTPDDDKDQYEIRVTAEFSTWSQGLKDNKAKAAISDRITRLRGGLFGDAKFFDGIWEMRIHIGPGYRVYFCREGKTIYLLLYGGTKRTQDKDIKRAIAMMKEINQ